MNIKVRQIYFEKEQADKVSENCVPITIRQIQNQICFWNTV